MKQLFTSVLILFLFVGTNAQTATNITVLDTRNDNTLPNGYSKEAKFEFKTSAIIGLPATSYYSGLLTFAPWGDPSGNKVHQLNFNDVGLYWRTGSQGSNWESWRKLLFENTDGNVGIETTNPLSRLHINTEYSSALRIERPGSNSYGFEIGGAIFGLYDYTNLQYRWRVNGQNILLAESGGSVGIGTADPNTLLHLKSTTTHPYIRFDKPNISTESGLVFGINGSSDFYLYTDNDNNSLKIQAGNLAGEGDPTPRMEFPVSNKNIYMGLSGGSVAIGSTDPGSARLRIYSDIRPQLLLGDAQTTFQINMATNPWDFAAWTKPGDVVFRSSGASHNLVFYMNDENNDGNTSIRFADNIHDGILTILNNTNVGIGTRTPEYKLDILGTARAWGFKINKFKTADFVFEPGYKLPSLDEVESFIAANRHLPGIASASQMEKNGVEMAELQSALLQKIEEMFLYQIQLKKENEAQKAAIEKQARMNKNLEQELLYLREEIKEIRKAISK